jgi:hypothetical protein
MVCSQTTRTTHRCWHSEPSFCREEETAEAVEEEAGVDAEEGEEAGWAEWEEAIAMGCDTGT